MPTCSQPCPVFFSRVPVLTLTLIRPHSVRTQPLFLHFKQRIKEQRVWVGSHLLGARKMKLKSPRLQCPQRLGTPHSPQDWVHLTLPFPPSSAHPMSWPLPEIAVSLHQPTMKSSVCRTHTGRVCSVYNVHRGTKHICKHLKRTQRFYCGEPFLRGNTDIVGCTFQALSLICLPTPSIPLRLP